MKILFNKLTLVIACVLLLINLSCQKDGIDLNGETDYIIFGSSYGFCVGECATTYLLKSDGLYKSTTYLKTGELNSFTEKLSVEKFSQVKGLEQKVPKEFLNENSEEKTFGCPDCADQGALFLEVARRGHQNKRFTIDTRTDGLPDYVKSVAIHIKAGIEIARN